MKKFILFFSLIVISLASYSQYIDSLFLDTITFEENYEYLSIDTSSQNIWQIGEPNKVFFDSAYTPNLAMVTDSVNYYPENNSSYFDIKVSPANFPSYGWMVFLEFTHKYDTDTLMDGGYITVSYDYGLTWMNIIEDNSWNYDAIPYPGEPTGLNLYGEEDALFNGEKGFSGNSGSWVTTEFGWHFYPVSPPGLTTMLEDTTIIRFNFVSDSLNNNKEGWLIDHIRLIEYTLMGSVNDLRKIDFGIFPNPVQDQLHLTISDNTQLKSYSIYSISGVQIINCDLSEGEAYTIDVSELKNGMYLLEVNDIDGHRDLRRFVIKR